MYKANFQVLFVVFLLICCFSITKSFSQHENSFPNSKTISVSALATLAEEVDFRKNRSAKIYTDKENTYYAIRKSSLEFRFVELRIIELIERNQEIIHKGQEKKYDYFFLFSKYRI